MNIVIAGPPAAGKSTVSTQLARRLNLPIIRIDVNRANRYQPYGYTAQRAEYIYQTQGALALLEYESRFEVRALGRSLQSRQAAVIDTGGGLLHQTRPDSRRDLELVMQRVHAVVLVLPFPHNRTRCAATLRHRLSARAVEHPDTAEWLTRGGLDTIDRLIGAALDQRPHCAAMVDTGAVTVEVIAPDAAWTKVLAEVVKEGRA